MFNFTLPSLSEDGEKVKSYLYQLTEQLRYVLNNIDTENFSPDIAKQFENTLNLSESLARMEEFVSGGLENLSGKTGELQDAISSNQSELLTIYHELMDSIAATAESITQNYTSAIEQSNTEITTKVSEEYTLKSETASLEAQVLSQFRQTARDMLAIFSEAYEGTEDSLGEFAATFNSYIRFSFGGIELGREDSSIVARLANNKLAFVQKGTGGEYEVAYISEKKLYITEANITVKLTIGADAHGVVYDIETDPLYGLRVTRRATG